MQTAVRTQELRLGRVMETTAIRKSKTAMFWEKNLKFGEVPSTKTV